MTTFAEYKCTGAGDSRSISSSTIKLLNISVVLYLITCLHYPVRSAVSRSWCQPSTMSHKWSRCTSNCHPRGTPIASRRLPGSAHRPGSPSHSAHIIRRINDLSEIESAQFGGARSGGARAVCGAVSGGYRSIMALVEGRPRPQWAV